MTEPLITAAQLLRFAPACDAAPIAPALDQACRAHGIVTPRRIRHFMAQVGHESLGFTRLVENLNYSAPRLVAVWPRRFPTVTAALPYAHNPERLAEKVYGGRLGNTHPGDGWKYRGGGWIELTGLDNYRRGERWSGLPLVTQPELARAPGPAAVIAASFWQAEGLNEIVDADAGEPLVVNLAQRLKLNEADDLREASEAVNGGTVGLEDRAAQLLRAAVIWPD
jgi:putative chitinase